MKTVFYVDVTTDKALYIEKLKREARPTRSYTYKIKGALFIPVGTHVVFGNCNGLLDEAKVEDVIVFPEENEIVIYLDDIVVEPDVFYARDWDKDFSGWEVEAGHWAKKSEPEKRKEPE